jgi:hypothetical protein
VAFSAGGDGGGGVLEQRQKPLAEDCPEPPRRIRNVVCGSGDCRFYEYTPAQGVRWRHSVVVFLQQIFRFLPSGRILNLFDADRKVKDPNQSEAIRGTIHAQAFSYQWAGPSRSLIVRADELIE